MQEITYPYKPKKTNSALVMGFFAVCGIVLGYAAYTNDRGLIILKMIELSPTQASVFYWVLTGMSAIFVVLGLFMLIKSIMKPAFIVLSATSVAMPRAGFSGKILSIDYADISNITTQQVFDQEFIILQYQGKKASISKSMLANKEAFMDLYQRLRERLTQQL